MNPQVTTQTITKSIRYTVAGSTGNTYTVTVDPCDARTACTCTAGSFGKDCRHQRSVREGQAGRPTVRLTQRPARRQPSDWITALEV